MPEVLGRKQQRTECETFSRRKTRLYKEPIQLNVPELRAEIFPVFVLRNVGSWPADAAKERLNLLAILTPDCDVTAVAYEAPVGSGEAEGVGQLLVPHERARAIGATIAALVFAERSPSDVSETEMTRRRASDAGISVFREPL